MSKLLRTVSFASASFKTLALAIVLVICGANTPFAQTLVCPDAADVDCLGDLPPATVTGLEGSGFEVSITFSDVVLSGSDCDVRIARTYVATFTRPDFSFSQTCVTVFRVADFEAPEFVDAPGNASYQCIDEVPAYDNLTAQDDCGGSVTVQQFGSSSSIDDTLVCENITTPVGPGLDWGLWVDGLMNLGYPSDFFRWRDTPSLVFSADGEARLIGDVVYASSSIYASNPNDGWHVDITLANGRDWSQWNGALGRQYYGFGAASDANHPDWIYYELLTTISRLEGFGAFEGSQLVLSHQPTNYYYGFQFGFGANFRNANNGGAGWFFYEGHVGRTSINGHGDVTVDMGCDNPNHPNELCEQTIERRWAATDNCGNVAYHTQLIEVKDETAPVFENCPADVSVQCAADEPAMVDPSTLIANDNCDGPVTVTLLSADTTGTIPCDYQITYTYVAADVCDNRSFCDYTVSVNDTEAPIIETPFDYTVECNEDVFFESASATDNCSGAVNVAESVDTTVSGCEITYTRSFFALDECGNESNATQVIRVIDTTFPVLTIPADAEFQCNDDVVFAGATATDNCTDELTIIETVDTINNGVDCRYTYIRTFSVSDDCGNTTVEVQTIEVEDTIDPEFTDLEGPYVVECDEVYDNQWTQPAATDNCDDNLTYVYIDSLTSGGCLGTVHRTVTVSDNCGNSTTQTFVIYVQDTTAPTFDIIPSDITVECSDLPGAPNVNDVTVSDNCGDVNTIYGEYSEGHNADITVTVTTDTIEGNCEGSYTILWIWTATDYCDNSASATTTITVVDTTDPIFISAPQNITIDCSQDLPEGDLLIAVDNCTDGFIESTFSDSIVAGNCPNSYSVERTYIATDDCGNSAEFVQLIFVTDLVAPIFFAENEVFYTYECGTTIPEIQPAVTDNCDLNLEFSFIDTEGGNPCSRVITRTWTAADDCGNTSDFVQVITVNDTQGPIISAVDSLSLPCDNYSALDASVSAFDVCSGAVQVTFSDEFVSGGCSGQVIRTLTAVDACGLSSTKQQFITLTDDKNPEASETAVEITVECSAAIPVYTPIWNDNCSDELTTNMTSETIGSGCSYQIVETYTATDACGNTGSMTRTINVVDTTAPQLQNVPANVTIDCNDDVPVAEGFSATDNCDNNVDIDVIESTASGNCPQNYSIERMFIATDWCGNADTAYQLITVVDQTAPIFFAENESIFTYTCPEVSLDQAPPVVTPSATEDCGLLSLTYTDTETGTPCNRVISRDWAAADQCGNVSHFVQTITIQDVTPPVFEGPNNVTAHCDDYNFVIDITASDVCTPGIEIEIVSDVMNGTGCDRTITRTYKAEDACGNEATFVQTIQLLDDEAPIVSNPPTPITRDCNQSIPGYTPVWTDNCDQTLTLGFNESAFTIGCSTVITRAYTATDDCGNTTTVNYVITLIDSTAPTATFVAPNQTLGCGAFGGVESIPNATFTDNCASPVNVVETVSESGPACNRVITITWTGTDQCGNSSAVSTVITLIDNSNPVFTSVPVGGTFSCEEGISFGAATATDACSGVTITHSDLPQAGACENEYVIVRTWIATDGCGNSAQATTAYTVVDNTAPVFNSIPEPLFLSCITSTLPETSASAVDACAGSVTPTYSDVLVENNGCDRIYRRTFTATDNCGNSSEAVQMIYAEDNDAPVFAGASETSLPCDQFDPNGIYVSASDVCGTATIDVISAINTNTGCNATWVLVYEASDNCGNTSEFTQTITLTDIVAPEANIVPANETYACNAAWSPANVTFTDNCDQNLTITATVDTIDNGCEVQYSYVWTATDDCNNVTTRSQLITLTDTIAPVINDSDSEDTVSCDALVTFAIPTATDECSGDVVVTESVNSVGDNCDRTVTTIFRAQDGCGNVSIVTHVVRYLDEAEPTWSAENVNEFTYECGTTAPVVQPVAEDNCNTITYNYVDVTNSQTKACTPTITRTWTATDACGNASQFVQTISFIDTEAPVLSGCPSQNVVLGCGDTPEAAAVVTASDACDSDVTVTFEEDTIGSVTNGSNLFTPVRPSVASAPCTYPYDWAMALFGLPSQYRWYRLDTSVPATLVDNGDNSITISGRLVNVLRSDAGFDFNVTYGEGLNWADWSGLITPNSFKADCGGEAANHPTWMYYILQSSSTAELIGWGDFAGSEIHLTHAPTNNYFGFQVGDGANNYNGDFGAGGWFLYGGDGDMLIDNGNVINSGSTQGIGDFAFRIEDCPGYTIERTWTAVDCAGNESMCTQTIIFQSLDSNAAGMMEEQPEGDRSAEIAILGVMPNPANDRSQISFMSTVDGKLSLQVLDMTGRVVGDLFNNEAEAGQVYTAEFDANVMSSGIYMVRLSSGTEFKIERLLIQR